MAFTRGARGAAVLALSLGLGIGCGASRASAVDEPAVEDAALEGPGAGSGGQSNGAAGSGGESAPDSGAVTPASTLCSTSIGSCRFDSSTQCPATQPRAGTSCGSGALACYYCPVTASSLAVSLCASGLWSNTRASCGG